MELQDLLSQLDVDRITRHIEWFTRETPRRISGLGQDKKAADYIVRELKKYGLESGIYEFEAYNSLPGSGSLEVTAPIQADVPCEPCAHVPTTPEDGVEAELVYVGPGGEEDYYGIDVQGKIVFAEVSYAPATPEKARIAWKNGAIGIILSNWGTAQHDVICMRALKGVWGNPTIKTLHEIPQLYGVTVSRAQGECLRQMCSEGRVTVKMRVSSPRKWEKLLQPYGFLRGATDSEEFLLVSGHLDAWEPGVTCNATGDATILELARVFSENAGHLRRNIWFTFWNGHEIAEAAGSTWFVDTFWPQISDNCVAYINIDSTGMKDTSIFEVSASYELIDLARDTLAQVFGPDEPMRLSYLSRTGDQSFFGIGVPAIAARHGFSDAYIKETHGATLGWWNHTVEDNLDKYDPEVMAKDVKLQAAYIWKLSTEPRLPYNFAPMIQDVTEKVNYLSGFSDGAVSLDPIKCKLRCLDRLVQDLNALDSSRMNDYKIEMYNQALMQISRHMTNAFYTRAERFEQDSYGLSILSKPIPLLYPLVELAKMGVSDEKYYPMKTELMRARNRVWDAVNSSVRVLENAMFVLSGG